MFMIWVEAFRIRDGLLRLHMNMAKAHKEGLVKVYEISLLYIFLLVNPNIIPYIFSTYDFTQITCVGKFSVFQRAISQFRDWILHVVF
jgi:hypothetical protein